MRYEKAPTFYTNISGKYNYIGVSFYAHDGRVKRNIGLITDKESFPDGLSKINKARIKKIESTIEEYVSLCGLSMQPITKQAINDIIDGITGKKHAGQLTIGQLLEKYKEGMKSGEFTYKNKKYSEASIKLVMYTKRATETAGISNVPVNSLTIEHIVTFRNKLLSVKKKTKSGDGLSHNTIATWNNCLIEKIKATYKKWHNNKLHKEDGVYLEDEDIDHAVAYNEDEIYAIYKHPFTGRKELVKDIFAYGSYICLRKSDMNSHDETNIQGDFLVHGTKKTATAVTVPLHPIVKEIIAKYGGNVPKMNWDSFSQEIKEVCKEAGFDEKIQFIRTQGGEVVKKLVPKWKLTSAHTMRRNFATNAIRAGMNHQWIMRIGGWKSYDSFKKYIRLSNMEIATEAAKHPFFN